MFATTNACKHNNQMLMSDKSRHNVCTFLKVRSFNDGPYVRPRKPYPDDTACEGESMDARCQEIHTRYEAARSHNPHTCPACHSSSAKLQDENPSRGAAYLYEVASLAKLQQQLHQQTWLSIEERKSIDLYFLRLTNLLTQRQPKPRQALANAA